MTVLITGAGGFIGRAVTALLTEREVPHIALQGRWAGSHALEMALGDAPLESCLHLGWYAHPRDYLTSVAGNVDSLKRSLELLEALIARRCPRLVGVGSVAEYATSSDVLTEASALGPASVYGSAKAALRTMIRGLETDLSNAWARPFNVTGPGEHRERLLPSVATRLANRQEVELSPGAQVRDYLDVRDVAAALVTVLESDMTGDVNVCSGTGHTLRDLLKTLAGDRAHLLRFGSRGYLESDSRYVVGDPTRLRALGWRPRVPLEQTLAEVAREAGL